MTMPSTHTFPFEIHGHQAIEPLGTGLPPGAGTSGSSHHLATPSLFHSYLHCAAQTLERQREEVGLAQGHTDNN